MLQAFLEDCLKAAATSVPNELRAFLQVKDPKRYETHAAIWQALKSGMSLNGTPDVRLVSLNWLMQLGTEGTPVNLKYRGVLSRRQDLPEEAFIGVEELRKIEAAAKPQFLWLRIVREALDLFTRGLSPLRAVQFGWKLLNGTFYHRNPDSLVPIIAVSYCWKQPGRPDPDGEQVKLLTSRLSRLYGGYGLLRQCHRYGFVDMGVFFDWASIYQKDPELAIAHWPMEGWDPKNPEIKIAIDKYEQSRSLTLDAAENKEMKDSFDRALYGTMDLWYGHTCTTVVLLTELWPEWESTQLANGARAPPLPASVARARPYNYDDSGWPTFERCSAELGKSYHLNAAKWKLVIDAGRTDGGAKRRLPNVPKRMHALLGEKNFTNGSDFDVVFKLYKKNCLAILGGKEEFDFSGLPLDHDKCSPTRLAETLNITQNLEVLYMTASKLTDRDLKDISRSASHPRHPPFTKKIHVMPARVATGSSTRHLCLH